MSEEYRVDDKDDRQVCFSGELLAFTTSEDRGKPRWIELRLYVTDGGNYVLSGVGMSDVDGEVDRPWVHVIEDAYGVLEQLYMTDDTGTRYLTRVARDLLTKAARVDDDVRSAYYEERIA